MTSKHTDILHRKDSILSIAVNCYIETVTPVSSSFIADNYFLDLSSATIRNVLAELEQEGFLTHPHTSAGRVPTQKGYRYFVDNLMHEIELLEAEKRFIKEEYERESLELEALLEKASKAISEKTHYTSIISVDGWDDRIFCKGTNYVVDYPEYQDLKKIESILIALEEKERILEFINKNLQKKVDIFIGNEFECGEIDNCSLVVSSYDTKKGFSGKIAVLGPTRMDYKRVVSTLDYFSQLIGELL